MRREDSKPALPPGDKESYEEDIRKRDKLSCFPSFKLDYGVDDSDGSREIVIFPGYREADSEYDMVTRWLAADPDYVHSLEEIR
ncbi:MAG: hypothetical protein SVU88_00885 [Candidatus Nanohaloarchaea archaeon]|nr:hypothetical protein [Candidatus Nanohaloarchaea archaeon]